MNTAILLLTVFVNLYCQAPANITPDEGYLIDFKDFTDFKDSTASTAGTATTASTPTTLFFLLGTLSDYMGRFTYVDKKKQVDRYYYYERPLVRYLDSIIKADLKISVSEKYINMKYETFSRELSLIINSYYENGLLIDTLIRTQAEICSFLTGRYYRYGRQMNDSIFRITLHNTPDHGIVEILLKRIGCTRIHLDHLKNIPAQYIYYFIPPEPLKKYFSEISGQKTILDKAYRTAAFDILGPDAEFDTLISKKNEKDLLRIIEIFSH